VYIAISALADKTTGNYDTVFAQFKAWALHMGYSHISPKVVNKYLSKVCFWKPTDFQAKNFRAAVDLLADVNQVDRPVNRLTARLVKAKVKAYQTGDQAIPQDSKVLPWLTSPPSSSIGAMMAILFLSGFRPFDLHRLCLACWDQARELLWAGRQKVVQQVGAFGFHWQWLNTWLIWHLGVIRYGGRTTLKVGIPLWHILGLLWLLTLPGCLLFPLGLRGIGWLPTSTGMVHLPPTL